MNTEELPTMGELIDSSRRQGFATVTNIALLLFLLVGVIYTGIHNYNLFARTMKPGQEVFALIPVVLLEGSVLLLTAGGFFAFTGGAQKLVAMLASWGFLVVIGINTVLDSQMAAGQAIPEWLQTYQTFVLYGTPVAMLAVLKAVLDLSPAKRKLDMQMAIEHAQMEGKYNAIRLALHSKDNRMALADFAAQYAQQLADKLRGVVPALPAAAQAPAVQMQKEVEQPDLEQDEQEEPEQPAPRAKKAPAPKG